MSVAETAKKFAGSNASAGKVSRGFTAGEIGAMRNRAGAISGGVA